jgi:hypothetical protein
MTPNVKGMAILIGLRSNVQYKDTYENLFMNFHHNETHNGLSVTATNSKIFYNISVWILLFSNF